MRVEEITSLARCLTGGECWYVVALCSGILTWLALFTDGASVRPRMQVSEVLVTSLVVAKTSHAYSASGRRGGITAVCEPSRGLGSGWRCCYN